MAMKTTIHQLLPVRTDMMSSARVTTPALRQPRDAGRS